MKSPFISLRASIALIALVGAYPPASIADAPGAGKIVKGRVVVKSIAGLGDEKLGKLLKKVGGKASRKLSRVGVDIIEVPVGQELAIANALSRDPQVLFAAPDREFPPAAAPNDPYYASEWHLATMGVPASWQYASGVGVTVAVCDTGVDASHPDLAGRLVAGWNTASNNSDTSDIHGHGTNVSGVVAAATNNAIGVASVAPGARVMTMRITNDSVNGIANSTDMAECVTWAADHGAKVVNISYSGAAGDPIVASAGSYLMSLGGVLVVAAANDGTDLRYDNSPYIFTVSATDRTDARPTWSNYGNYVDVSAPGVDIYTTGRSGQYWKVYGTSFSSPNVAATAALVMSANSRLTPTDVTSIITHTAKDLGAAGYDPYFGFGRVDAGAAVALAASAEPSDFTPPSVAVATPTTGATVKELITVDVQATDEFGVTSVDLFADGVLVGTDTQEDPANPYIYRFAWDSTKVSDGIHMLTAKAKDAAGNVGSAREVSVTVANKVDTAPPTFTSKMPASGAVVSGVMTMSATATDNVGTPNVTVSGGGVNCSGTGSASCTLNLKKVPVGTTIVVSFTATDAAGNRSQEQSSVVVGGTTTTRILPSARTK